MALGTVRSDEVGGVLKAFLESACLAWQCRGTEGTGD